jgi:hypothetical protein
MQKWSLSLLALFTACEPTLIVVGSPCQRYDHNRTQPLSLPSQGSTIVTTKVYIPFGSEDFPKLEANTPSLDGLPIANLVPTFTGVPLPLSTAPALNGKSDYDDLLDYLSSGPEADHGVEPPSTAGELTEKTKTKYKRILELLTSDQLLRSDEATIREWAKNSSIRRKHIVSQWVESRYSADSFQNALGIQFGDFWFLFYRLPERESFSRLVVVPLPIKKQDFSGKAPE